MGGRGKLTVCVDANIVLRVLLPSQLDAVAERLLRGWAEGEEEVIGPPLLYSEVASVLRSTASRGGITQAEAESLFRLFEEMGVRRVDHADMHRLALSIAGRFGQGRAYDAHYLALGELVKCDVWTADGRFYRAAAPSYSGLRQLEET